MLILIVYTYPYTYTYMCELCQVVMQAVVISSYS